MLTKGAIFDELSNGKQHARFNWNCCARVFISGRPSSVKICTTGCAIKAEADLKEWENDYPKCHLQKQIHASSANTDKPMYNPADTINQPIQSNTDPLNRSNIMQISRRCYTKSKPQEHRRK